jgi:hypothetical protein
MRNARCSGEYYPYTGDWDCDAAHAQDCEYCLAGPPEARGVYHPDFENRKLSQRVAAWVTGRGPLGDKIREINNKKD